MTELSPAAQAVLDAAMESPEEMPYEHDIAAALRAVNEHVVLPKYQFAEWELAHAIHKEIETIAAELEGAQ